MLIKAIAIEGHQPDHCLLMTFTRASTRELRARVRQRLLDEIDQLNRGESELARLYPDHSLPTGLERLHHALRQIDTIDIQTIHGFAIRLVNDFGPAAGIPSFPVETDTEQIRQEVIIDCYRELAKMHGQGLIRELTGGLSNLMSQAELAWKPIDQIKPQVKSCPDLGAIASEFAQAKAEALNQLESLKTLKGLQQKTLIGHCDIIEQATKRTQIPDTTVKYFLSRENDHRGTGFDQWVALLKPLATERAFRSYCLHLFREAYRQRLSELGITDNDQIIRDAAWVAEHLASERPEHTLILVDEFQDTDRHQWSMLDQLYPDTPTRLMMMVGDPKQAIYRFRGADTAFYHQVVRSLPETSRWNLDTVYRSTETLVEGLNSVFDSAHPVGQSLRYHPLTCGRPEDTPPLVLDHQELTGFQWIEALTPERVVQLSASLLSKGRQGTCQINGQPVLENDLCILVQSRATAAKIKHIGERYGLPFHYQNKARVFTHRISRDMVSILEAIANPDDLGKVTSAVATPLMGFELNHPGLLIEHPAFVEYQSELFNARDRWLSDGPAASIARLFERCQTATRFPNTLDGLEDWNLLMQCLEIFGEDGKGLSPIEAAHWWAKQASNTQDADDRTSQRSPTESQVIRINTIHGAKGLEYPVVILADSITGKSLSKHAWGLDYCDAEGSKIDLTSEALAAAQKDQDEDLNRLLYVALTRAKQTVFLGIPDSENAVSKLLHGRDVDALGVHHSTLTVPNADTSRQAFVPPTEKIARLQQPKIPSWFFRSFSTLIKHDAHLDSARGADDEEVVTTEFGLNADWHKLPGGTETGQFIHDILEWHAQAHREDTDIDRLINKRWPAHLDLSHAPLVGQWIRQILSVELYPGVSLNQLGVSQKRPEPQFELPLKPDLRAQTLFNACRAFSWWEPLEPPIDQPIAGHLIGFIDLVFEYQGRFHIIDYKTNYLGPNDSSYGDVQLQAAMQRSFYPLQAAIYGLALHRWLGSRLPDYDPDRHLGDVTYLFCRGIHSNNAGLWRRPLETPGILALEEQCLCTR